jgi:hypothetical protein
MNDSSRFDNLMITLQEFRDRDHSDFLYLHRNQVIELIEGVKALQKHKRLQAEDIMTLGKMVGVLSPQFSAAAESAPSDGDRGLTPGQFYGDPRSPKGPTS